MKKIIYSLAVCSSFFAFNPHPLFAMGEEVYNESSTSHLTITFHNEDIEPVKNGSFLRDQQFLAKNMGGKQPASGLFQIPNGRNNEGDAFPLFSLVPVVKIITNDDKIIELPTKKEQDDFIASETKNRRLGLPGESIKIVYPVANEDILSVVVFLRTSSYGYTGSGGGVFMTHGVCHEEAILTPNISCTPEENKPLYVAFSWPKTLYDKKDYKPQKLKARFYNNDESDSNFPKKIERNDFEMNWKKVIGLSTDNKEENKANYPICYPTRGLTRKYEGADMPTDLLNLGNDFSFYSGHPLLDNPYRKK